MGELFEFHFVEPRDDYWEAVTNIDCPVCERGIVEWAEAGYVPGYRICSECGEHFIAEGDAAQPVLRVVFRDTE